ncbi:MAG: winged helix-turn-helix domain-containing protein [Bdellovibrionaceae bacterium]|nr:winged helix-turn-helix domain-containing protein [Pseudobdellovibrionaceae bacterium]
MSAELDRTFELGKLYFDRGDFEQAVDNLKEAASLFFAGRQFSDYLKCQNILLKIYAEREQQDEIHATKERLQDLVLKEGFELNSKTYYTLALCASNKEQQETALDYLQKALAIALAADNKEDICYAIFGLASVYSRMNPPRLQEALKEIYNLEVFFQVINIPELRLSTQMLNARILQELKKYDEAIDLCWKAYDHVKETKNIVYSVYLLGMLGTIYFDMGDKDMARMYMSLARKSCDPKNYVRLSRMINHYFDKLGGVGEQSFDLIFDEENHTVIERKLGRIEFKNQFILLDLLKLFVQNQGSVYSKEYLVEHVWKQPYDPAIHDNKIYVTIKRLRKLIEPDYEKPKYIFRAKNGYYMNKAARVHLEQSP